jgi:hypothetical protein
MRGINMSKILDRLVETDLRFDKRYPVERDGCGYYLYLDFKYHIQHCHTIVGYTVKEILDQLKYIEVTYWDIDAPDGEYVIINEDEARKQGAIQ